jgi:transcriptional regulator with XRE-family HTH domain
MKTFGQVIMEARKKAGLTQKEVAERLRGEDGRKVLPPYLNDLEQDRRYPPENSVIDQAGRDSRARPVLHPRHVYYAVSLRWRRSRLGCQGLWYFRADDFPALSELDPGVCRRGAPKSAPLFRRL